MGCFHLPASTISLAFPDPGKQLKRFQGSACCMKHCAGQCTRLLLLQCLFGGWCENQVSIKP